MFLCSCLKVPPPTPKSVILSKIQKYILVITLIYSSFIFWSQPVVGFSYLASSVFLFNAYRQISYFSCVIHQLFCWCMCVHVFHGIALSYRNGILSSQLNMELINKLFIIAFSVFCFYFDFVAYKEYKAIAVEVKEEGEI